METTDDEVTRKRKRQANPKYQAAYFEVPSRTSCVLDVPQVPEFAGPLPPQGHTLTPQHPLDCSPVGWATPSTPRHQRGTPQRHLEYQVEDFSSTREEYLEKIKRQTEEIVHLRAQLALQSRSHSACLRPSKWPGGGVVVP
ncbi:hypothetical protein UPYG_G00320580 [Umbra pygmaea]|uniref:Uncharacterized protein n=1 Tax=Umbra pygmaea TaxID=75934 RepID=A0ABD0W0C4_UMBPY